MPAADFRIHENQLARTELLDGVSIRADVLYTSDKGEQKDSNEKRTRKILQKLCPVLQRINSAATGGAPDTVPTPSFRRN